jgi:hypothetical protein
MAEAICHLHVTAETQLRLQVSSYGICSVQSGTGTAFLMSTSVFIINITSTFTILNSRIMAWVGHKVLVMLKVVGRPDSFVCGWC